MIPRPLTWDEKRDIQAAAQEATDRFEPYEIENAQITRLRKPGCHTYVLAIDGNALVEDPSLGSLVSNLLFYIQTGKLYSTWSWKD